MWTDNIEVVQGCKKEGMRLLPSKATGRNVDMWMQIRELKGRYAGELEVIHVKGHQDDHLEYDKLSFEGKKCGL